MKNKPMELMLLPKAAVVRNNRQHLQVKKKPLNYEELNTNAEMVEKLWEMYNLQLKRTHDMMVLCETQQQELEQAKEQLRLLKATNDEKGNTRKERERKLEPISFDEVTELGKYLMNYFPVYRTSYAHALVKMLYALKQLRGTATPEQLFNYSEITEVSGFRYANHLKNGNFMVYNPTNKKGYYEITVLGKKFLAKAIKTRKDFENLKVEFGYDFRGGGYDPVEREKELKVIHERNKHKKVQLLNA